MEALQYLENRMALDNCKEYLKLIDFIPEQAKVWDLVNSFVPEFIMINQKFRSEKNRTFINFAITDFNRTDFVDCDYVLNQRINVFYLDVELLKNQLSKISIRLSSYPGLYREVSFLNNRICKVIEQIQTEKVFKERLTYYKNKKQIYTALYDCQSGRHNVENVEFIEQATNPACNIWYHDVSYQRNYVEESCYIKKYHEAKEELSYNQFEKKNKGVLKRIRKLAQTPENKNLS